MNLKTLLEYLLITERKSDIEYISLINLIKELIKIGEPYFKDISAEIDDASGMIYKVYELIKPPYELQLIGLDELYITVVNPNKDLDKRYRIKKAEINPQNEMILFPSPTKFKNFKSGNMLLGIMEDIEFEQAIEHELTHQINKLKAKNKLYRSVGGKEQFIPNSEAYINSTEEIQARLIPIIKSIHVGIQRNNDAMGRILKKYIMDKDFKSFKEYIFGFYYKQLHLDRANEKTKKRYIARLYETYKELIISYEKQS